ncbi:MAG: hypothetical protein R3291_03970, partial [Thermoplasmata archaeon]|nr:hypothetical protein [Thermoplasmata archaeon]
MILALPAVTIWRTRNVEVGAERLKVSKGLKRYVVRLADVVAVFTTMMPKGKSFQEVLAVEFV